MDIINDAWRKTDLPREVVATIGNYDGVHLGQQRVLEKVVSRAGELGCPAVTLTFEPHPLQLLRHGAAPPALATRAQKEELLASAGIDALLVMSFDEELARQSADTFVREFLVRRLRVRELYVGATFAFGRDRRGNRELLARLGDELGFLAEGVEEVRYRGEPVSSTRIRRALAEGRVDEATAMLGRPYVVAGSVVRGDRMGQRLGWPTINVSPENEILPLDGVYVSRVAFTGLGSSFDGTTNIGTRPTVYENFQRVLETHILDFSSDVYGERVEVSFHKRLRDERLFPSIMDLSAQIRRDVESTREYFAARRRLEESGAFVDIPAVR